VRINGTACSTYSYEAKTGTLELALPAGAATVKVVLGTGAAATHPMVQGL
jgi:hypothetical protein